MTLCERCRQTMAWGRSPLCYGCLGEVELLVTSRGAVVDSSSPPPQAQLYAARYRFRPVRCGKKDCGSCPHYWYAYRTFRVEGRAQETYLGPADRKGSEYEKPKLRRPRAAFGGKEAR